MGKRLYPLSVFPVHFDVTESQLKLSTFVQAANSIQDLVNAVNEFGFDGKLSIEVVVLTPHEGSFLKRLGVCVVAGGAAAWAFLESDIGSAFIKGLTNEPSAYWSEKAGKLLRDKIELFLSDEPSEIPKDEEDGGAPDDEALDLACSFALVDMAAGFLSAPTEHLSRLGITPRRARMAYDSRNAFYAACTNDRSVFGIGFTEEHKFPIKRSDFIAFQVALPPEDELDEVWSVEIAELSVTSPNWDRKDMKRSWKARDITRSEKYFYIDDNDFWTHVADRDLRPTLIDKIKVQWAFHQKEGRKSDYRVIKVLQYNDVTLSKPLSHEALEALLGPFTDLGYGGQSDMPLFRM